MLKLMTHQSYSRLIYRALGSRAQSSYIVLLPEDPIDTAENNALLRLAEGSYPDFTSLNGEKCFSGMGKLSIDFECGLWEVEEKLRDEENTDSFESVIEPLDKIDAQLNVGWGASKILYTTRQDILPQKTYMSLHDRARKARVHKFHSLPIYNSCKNIKTKYLDSLDTCQKRILDKFLLESRLNGIELSPEKADHFGYLSKELDQYKTYFRQKLSVSTSRFSYQLSDSIVVKSLPKDLLQRMSSDGMGKAPYTVSLKPDIYNEFMANCPVRGLRWNSWQAYNMRASKKLDEEVDNSVNIENIRKYKQDQAKLLGYDNFASLSMETKMAGNVENVLSMITTLQALAVPRQAEDMETLTEFAMKEGFSGDSLQAYDVPYYSTVHKQHLYGITKNIHEYLPFEHVWGVMLQLTSQLFGLEFEEIAPSEDLKTWHPTVRYFNVIDKNGGHIASFYLDPYKRDGVKMNPTGNSGWCISLRGRTTQCTVPSSALVYNFTAPTNEGQHSLLSMKDLIVLFSKFGECLQHLLTTVPYGEVSGLTNVEWDAMGMTQHFMANWIFVPEVLSSLCSHHSTGEPITESQVTDVIKASNHMAAHNICKHLYLSHLDMALHTRPEFWVTLMTDLWPQYLPYQLDKNDAHVCSYSDSLTDVWSAAYYSHTWCRVMAADCTAAFLNDGDFQHTGKRFRDTFLSLGGGEHSAEVFRSFRGRDPSPSALCDLYGIA